MLATPTWRSPDVLEDLPSLFDRFVADARTTLVVPGASAELSITGKFDNFLTAALPVVAPRPLHVSQQTGTEFGIPDFRVDAAGELLGWVEFTVPEFLTGTR